MTESTREISELGLEELKALLVQALEEVARLKAENAKLREEIEPSGMEKAAGAARSAGRKGRRAAPSGGCSPKRRALAIDETRILKPDSLPQGARFKGIRRLMGSSHSKVFLADRTGYRSPPCIHGWCEGCRVVFQSFVRPVAHFTENRLGVLVKATNEHGLYGYFVSDKVLPDGTPKIHRSYNRPIRGRSKIASRLG